MSVPRLSRSHRHSRAVVALPLLLLRIDLYWMLLTRTGCLLTARDWPSCCASIRLVSKAPSIDWSAHLLDVLCLWLVPCCSTSSGYCLPTLRDLAADPVVNSLPLSEKQGRFAKDDTNGYHSRLVCPSFLCPRHAASLRLDSSPCTRKASH
jgi:hypothetical protein